MLARRDSGEALAAPVAARLAALVTRRLAGEPVAYLLRDKEFWGRRFTVDDRVLVPRPETEHLIEAALSLTPELPASARVLDVGAGSGAIAVTLALERPAWRVLSGDISLGALAVAAGNARQLEGDARFVGMDVGEALRPGVPLDLVVANPPYVDAADPATFDPAVARWEPASALFADEGGLAVSRRIVDFTVTAAAERAVFLVLEIGWGQADRIRAVLIENGLEIRAIVPDLAGIPRTVVARAGPARHHAG